MARRPGGGIAARCGCLNVAPDGIEQVDRAGMESPHFLAAHDLADDVALLDQERVLANVLHLQREQLLRGAEPLVGNQRDHRRRVQLAVRN